MKLLSLCIIEKNKSIKMRQRERERYYGGTVSDPESGDGGMESDMRGSASDSRRQGKKKELILDCDMSVKPLGVRLD
jgi:hypothetical protein